VVLASPPDPAELRVRTALFRTRITGLPVALAFQSVGRVARRARTPTGNGRAARWIRRRAESVGTPPAVLFATAHALATAPPAGPPDLAGVPVLVVVGDKDRTVSPAVGRRLAHAGRGSAFVAIPHAGHHVMESQPGMFQDVLRSWLADIWS
jgi:pimeloyl-ACP methyl ester carboxylesterase